MARIEHTVVSPAERRQERLQTIVVDTGRANSVAALRAQVIALIGIVQELVEERTTP